jgi:hypothetical protein
MDREYDIFESLPDGTPIWRGFVRGVEEARGAVVRLASESRHECFAMHTPTKEVVARASKPPDGPQTRAIKQS